MPHPRRILFFAVPPIEPLDLFGPLEVFRIADELYQQGATYRTEVASWRRRFLPSDAGVDIRAHGVAPFKPRAVDTFVVVGGTGPLAKADPELETWVRKMSRLACRTVSICTGAFVLARAGLLDGRHATTHWAFTDELARSFEEVHVEPNQIWVEDGNVFTSAGILTGVDLALALVARDVGAHIALETARALVVFVQRSGGQTQFSATLAAQRAESLPIREVQAWIVEHLAEEHSVDTLARRAGMSPRNFSRVFARESGFSPARFVLRTRVEAARRWLERSERGIDEIAALVGFKSTDVMTRAFKRELGTTPNAYRQSFRAPRGARMAQIGTSPPMNELAVADQLGVGGLLRLRAPESR
jgi:transcriptional regulator GlxA family with amidase domain